MKTQPCSLADLTLLGQRSYPVRLVPCVAIAILVSSVAGADENWPRLRGANNTGVMQSAELPAPVKQDNILWQVDIPGKGHSSPVVWGDRIFLLTSIADEQPSSAPTKGKKKGRKKGAGASAFSWVALCLDRETGKTLWKKEFPKKNFKGHRYNSAASSTPAVDEKRVVFTRGTADMLTMFALSPEDGSELWSTDLGPVNGGHGYGASPMLHGDLVVLNNDQEKQSGNLLAVHADTGKVAWTVERRSQRISYSVPCVYDDEEGERLIFTNWQHGFTAVDPQTGNVIADKSVFNTETNERAISSPVMAGPDLVIGTCGFTSNPKHCVAMRLEGSEWKEIWRIERNVPHIPSVLVVGELAFLIDDSGIGTCVTAATGEEHWRERLPNVQGKIFGSPVSDGSHIYFVDESGVVHSIAASKEFQPVGQFELKDGCQTTPAISQDTLFVRSASKLTAIR